MVVVVVDNDDDMINGIVEHIMIIEHSSFELLALMTYTPFTPTRMKTIRLE